MKRLVRRRGHASHLVRRLREDDAIALLLELIGGDAHWSPQTLVRDIMSTQVAYVEPDDTVEDCMALMTEKRIRYLPVVKDGAVVGIISIGDLVKSVIDEQRFTIHQLETYFSGDLYTH